MDGVPYARGSATYAVVITDMALAIWLGAYDHSAGTGSAGLLNDRNHMSTVICGRFNT